MKRIYIRVTGFTNVERHALNTVFRLSQEAGTGRSLSYEPWMPGQPELASLALVDGASGAAAQELQLVLDETDMGLIWVGAITPAKAWRSFTRPLRWPDILTAMDMYFQPDQNQDQDLDYDLGLETLPAQLDAQSLSAGLYNLPAAPAIKRALIADADGPTRMYLRTMLAAVHITHVDEVSSVQQAHAKMANYSYCFVSIDLGLTDNDPWQAVTAARAAAVVLVTANSMGLVTQLNAKVNGFTALQKPLDRNKLTPLLLKL